VLRVPRLNSARAAELPMRDLVDLTSVEEEQPDVYRVDLTDSPDRQQRRCQVAPSVSFCYQRSHDNYSSSQRKRAMPSWPTSEAKRAEVDLIGRDYVDHQACADNPWPPPSAPPPPARPAAAGTTPFNPYLRAQAAQALGATPTYVKPSSQPTPVPTAAASLLSMLQNPFSAPASAPPAVPSYYYLSSVGSILEPSGPPAPPPPPPLPPPFSFSCEHETGPTHVSATQQVSAEAGAEAGAELREVRAGPSVTTVHAGLPGPARCTIWVPDPMPLAATLGSQAGEVSSPPLTGEQQRVLDLVDQGRNVFFTGAAAS
jgi:hypothetical protein